MADPAISIEDLVPGGIVRSDHLHVGSYDETCSRCRRSIPEEQTPLLLWVNSGDDMYSFCGVCIGWDAEGEEFDVDID